MGRNTVEGGGEVERNAGERMRWGGILERERKRREGREEYFREQPHISP